MVLGDLGQVREELYKLFGSSSAVRDVDLVIGTLDGVREHVAAHARTVGGPL
jgi:hypothetical protein